MTATLILAVMILISLYVRLKNYLKKRSDDLEAMELYLEVLVQKQDYQLVTKKAEDFLESFPT